MNTSVPVWVSVVTIQSNNDAKPEGDAFGRSARLLDASGKPTPELSVTKGACSADGGGSSSGRATAAWLLFAFGITLARGRRARRHKGRRPTR